MIPLTKHFFSFFQIRSYLSTCRATLEKGIWERQFEKGVADSATAGRNCRAGLEKKIWEEDLRKGKASNGVADLETAE